MRSWLPSPSSREFSQLGWLPRVVFGAGGLLLVFAFARAVLTFRHGGSVWVAAIDFVFMGAPAVALMYTGQGLPESEISRGYYPRIIAWILGGIAVMYGFIALRDLHPGVSAEWSIGTQAIALTIGSIGGLVIGVQETKASIRTEQLEAHQRELQRQNEQLERFARVVSHDLRDPLTVAYGRLELAADERESAHLDDGQAGARADAGVDR